MAKRSVTVDIPLFGGVEEKSDNLQISLDGAARIENLVHDKAGRLSQRRGYEDLTTSVTSRISSSNTYAMTDGEKGKVVNLGNKGDNLLAYHTNGVLAFSDSKGQWYETSRSGVYPMGIKSEQLDSFLGTVEYFDTANSPSATCIVFQTAALGVIQAMFMLVDPTDNTIILPPTTLIGPNDLRMREPQVTVINSDKFLIYALENPDDPTLDDLYVTVVNANTFNPAIEQIYQPTWTLVRDNVGNNNVIRNYMTFGWGSEAQNYVYTSHDTGAQLSRITESGNVPTVSNLALTGTQNGVPLDIYHDPSSETVYCLISHGNPDINMVTVNETLGGTPNVLTLIANESAQRGGILKIANLADELADSYTFGVAVSDNYSDLAGFSQVQTSAFITDPDAAGSQNPVSALLTPSDFRVVPNAVVGTRPFHVRDWQDGHNSVIGIIPNMRTVSGAAGLPSVGDQETPTPKIILCSFDFSAATNFSGIGGGQGGGG